MAQGSIGASVQDVSVFLATGATAPAVRACVHAGPGELLQEQRSSPLLPRLCPDPWLGPHGICVLSHGQAREPVLPALRIAQNRTVQERPSAGAAGARLPGWRFDRSLFSLALADFWSKGY